MNARGKPLTNFENLKAELGQFIERSNFNKKYKYTLKHNSDGEKPVDVVTYFLTKIDTAWSDYFWNIRNKTNNKFDDRLLNLLAFTSLNETVRGSVGKFDSCINKFGNSEGDLTYYQFKNFDLLNEESIINYIDTLDLLVSDDEIIKAYFKNEYFIEKKSIISSAFEKNFNARYEQRVMFYAIFKFLISNKTELNVEELYKWDRIVRNLVKNTIYNTSKDFSNSIMAIDSLIESYNGDIYGTLLLSKITGFDTQQIKEEKLKINLFNLPSHLSTWESVICDMEDHSYLNGQIILLLSFSGLYDKYLNDGFGDCSVDEFKDYMDSIQLYFKKFKLLFNSEGLVKFDNEIFRRALLTKGDYLLYSTNWSLLINNHRDISWKRLFKETGNKSSDYYMSRCSFLKELFDDVDVTDIEQSLKNIIANHNCEDGWRKDFIEHPILIKKSERKYFKFRDEDVYALRKSKYNKYADPEIKSVLLKEALLKKGFDESEIELGYIESLGQYGIIRIKNLKPKVVYNHDGEEQYLVKQKGKDDFCGTKQVDVLNYLIANFNPN